MTRLTLATWNINSVRLRLPLLRKLIRARAPDVICLQETKCRDAEFPRVALERLGYRHQAISGQKGYHGVAIVSKLPFAGTTKHDFCLKGDARHIAATLAGPVPLDIHNFYVPAGGDIPDRELNIKFGHKLDFLDEMASWSREGGIAAGDAVLVGDLNVAPLEHDVWSHKQLLKIVSHTPVEVARMESIFAAGPWVDGMRQIVPANQKLYTWWSYRAPDWVKANKGRRLDHVWLSPTLAPHLGGIEVLREARGWDRPSDHVPVIATIERPD